MIKRLLKAVNNRNLLMPAACLAFVALAFGFHVFVKAADNPQQDQPPVGNNTAVESESEASEVSIENLLSINLKHASCITDLINSSTEPSTTYNPNNPYNLSFIIGSSTPAGLNGFYDINGDSLPDYIYTSNNTTSYFDNVNNTSYTYNTFQSCVYLNNGQGWTKTYRCHAYTRADNTTGQTVEGRYYGDCAGSN